MTKNRRIRISTYYILLLKYVKYYSLLDLPPPPPPTKNVKCFFKYSSNCKILTMSGEVCVGIIAVAVTVFCGSGNCHYSGGSIADRFKSWCCFTVALLSSFEFRICKLKIEALMKWILNKCMRDKITNIYSRLSLFRTQREPVKFTFT